MKKQFLRMIVLLDCMIMVIIVLMAVGCTTQKGSETLPFYGKWKVGEAIDVGPVPRGFPFTKEDKNSIIGSVVEYTPNEVRYRGMVLRDPVYEIQLLPSDEWPMPQIMDPEGFKPVGRVNYAMLGFKSPSGVWRVEVVEEHKGDIPRLWTYKEMPDDGPCLAEPVMRFLVDSNGTLVFDGDSGFYRAERVK